MVNYMNLFVIFLIAISLSMDAFSLALSIGTMSLSQKTNVFLSAVVGVFHFFMPILGSILGFVFVTSLHVNAHFLSGIIFLYIAILMFKDYKEDEEEKVRLSFLGIIIFALGVSLDSFGVGFALNSHGIYRFVASSVFSITSFTFTFLGLNLGKKLNLLIGRYSILFGASIMTILALINFVNLFFSC